MTKRRIFAVLVIVAAALVTSVVLLAPGSDGIRVTASSGTDPAGLVSAAQKSENSAATGVRRDVAWRSRSETAGAWVEIAFAEPTRVEHVAVLGAGKAGTGFTSAVLTFDDGASLMLTANDVGDAAVTFPGRTASRVRLTIAGVPSGATSVALAGFSVDRSQDWRGRHSGDERVIATTSSTADAPASALTDGRPARGRTGAEWTAAQSDPAPWAELSWPSPRQVASVQIFGPASVDASDPSPAVLHGLLRFSDGSTVVVSGIASGNGEPTTLAFTPRIATSVRLEIERSAPAVTVGLRELAVYDAGRTPPRWPTGGEGYSVSPRVAETCDGSTSPVTEPVPGRLTLVCPSPGSAVDGRATVVVAADPQTPLRALAWRGATADGVESVDVVASATAGADGRATFSVGTSDFPRGPLTLRVQADVQAPGAQDPASGLYVQLVNLAGQQMAPRGAAPAGMTLQWDEEFTDPLSISATGAGADYAATKPDASGSSQFGEAAFADPASGDGTLATVAGDYLRIRAKPEGKSTDGGAGGPYVSGILSSAHVGGSGFAAQLGYFEARILGAPGPGSWPAFWMLNTESAARRTGTAAEVDAVELYGHSTLGSCQTVHNWNAALPQDPVSSAPACTDPNGFSDWALAWHTYGVRIVPDGVVFSIDGAATSTVRGLIHSSEPFFFLLDLALGGGWPIDLTPTADVTDLYVDWVRVYT